MSFTRVIGGGVDLGGEGANPGDITNLELWLDAQVGITLGTSPDISQWDDQSGNDRHYDQSTVAARPHINSGGGPNSLDAVNFNAGQYMDATSIIAANITNLHVICVTQVTSSPASSAMIWAHQDSVTPLVQCGVHATNNTVFHQFRDTIGNLMSTFDDGLSAAWVLNTWHIFEFKFDKTNDDYSVIVDEGTAVTDTTNVSGTVSSTTEFLGATDQGGGPIFSYGSAGGVLAEIVIYSKELSASELTAVRTYLKDKYAL